jgi:hypothetical protein
MHDIIPDIMTTGKPLGNGHPLAVAISSKEIANSLGRLQTMVRTSKRFCEIEFEWKISFSDEIVQYENRIRSKFGIL